MAAPCLLIVDDSATIRAMAKVFLVNLKLEHREAATAQEGLTVARIYKPRVIIVDFKMPGMDGFEFARALRASAEPGLSRIPLIMLTGAAKEQGMVETAKKAGITRLLGKPIDGKELAETVRMLLGDATPPESP